MLFSVSFFRSRHLAPPRARIRHSRGYSLVELAATIVMIAAIAVLSLPTYKDFEPHEEFVGASPAALPQQPPESDGESAEPDQSINQPMNEAARSDHAGRVEEPDDPDRTVG